MKYSLYLIVFLFLYSNGVVSQAQVRQQKDAAEIYQDLLRFNTLGSVLYVAAHPDDENTRLLSWLVGERKLRTAYVALNRGDGGQNLIGPELGPLLGVIRTQELLAARKIDGAEQYFTRAYDFGFSKSPEESIQKWNQDSILEDLVVLIRKFKPDVMICRFPTTGEGGHGHHTASAILAQKAFDLAADKNYKVTGDLPPWIVQRLFWNTFSFGSVNTTSEDQLKLHVGNYNPIIGKSYGEIASQSRSRHQSQGFGTASTRGDVVEYFVQWRGTPVKKDLFENMNFTWSRIPRSQAIQKLIRQTLKTYQVSSPEKSLPALLEIRKRLIHLQNDEHYDADEKSWLDYKLKQLDNLIAQSAGIWSVATSPTEELVGGDSVEIQVQWIQRAGNPVQLEKISVGNQLLARQVQTLDNQLLSLSEKIQVPKKTPLTTPYWLVNPLRQDLYYPTQDLHGNAAYLDNGLIVHVKYRILGQDLDLSLPLNHHRVDPVKGEIFEPVVILPPITMKWSEPLSIHPNGQIGVAHLRITAHTSVSGGSVILDYPDSWSITFESGTDSFPALKKGASYDLDLRIATSGQEDKTDTLFAKVELQGQTYDLQLDDIRYAHIPRQTVLTRSHIVMTAFPIQKHRVKIGYIQGAGDLVANALKQLGYEIVPIDETNYRKIDWSSLNVVVTGIRAYNTHLWLNEAYPMIMHYVQNGGHLLVQYNTNSRLGPVIAKIFPYPLEISTKRVTVEEAPVQFLDSTSNILKQPNIITQQDFKGWIQERGIYFANNYSKDWHSVLSMHDPGDQPADGSIVWADYGKGTLIYTGLVFFRELPAGIPGAFRLFTNLIEFKQ